MSKKIHTDLKRGMTDEVWEQVNDWLRALDFAKKHAMELYGEVKIDIYNWYYGIMMSGSRKIKEHNEITSWMYYTDYKYVDEIKKKLEEKGITYESGVPYLLNDLMHSKEGKWIQIDDLMRGKTDITVGELLDEIVSDYNLG